MQENLPLIPAGANAINNKVCVDRLGSFWTYYADWLPIYTHDAADHNHFRFVIAQLVQVGLCRPCEIIATFGVTKNKIMRASKQLETRGARSFFEKRKTRRGGTVLMPVKLALAQNLLNCGTTRSDVALELDVRLDTLRKAINDGRLTERHVSTPVFSATTMSARSAVDGAAAAGMGTACTRPVERVCAALGLSAGAPVRFEACLDVPFGGVLCAFPALLSNGLITGIEMLGQVSGYYTRIQTLLILGIMCLCRIRTIERLRSYPPGELGKLIGLDRSPEARCLRMKTDQLAGSIEAEQWAGELSRQWMQQSLEFPGFLYIDGHVKVYSGNRKLPRRYVSRQRLCLRGISNYWVNDAIGRPIFVVERQIDDGLLQTMRRDIIPCLLEDVPNQPSEEQLEENPYLCRFIIVFDREGYSPAFFREMWQNHRIACMTYRKNCRDVWPLEWFKKIEAVMPRGGEMVNMQLAERGTLMGKGKNAIWVKEIRKLTENGHQTAIVSTAFELQSEILAPHMFTRWCQENFFAYAMHHFPIDILTEYGSEPFSGTEKMVNPIWRETERQRNSAQGKLDRRRAKFVAMDSEVAANADHARHEKWEISKAELLEEMEQLAAETKRLSEEKKKFARHITWEQLPEEEKFMKMPNSRRRLINTIGMIAYRAETAMASLLCGFDKKMNFSDARTLLQALFVAHADILPNIEKNILEIRLHSASTPINNQRLLTLCGLLNETETVYPGTKLKMIFSSNNSTVQKVEMVPPNLP